MLKTEEDLNRIKESCDILSFVFKEIKKHVDIGITTKEIDNLAYDLITKKKGTPAFLNYQGFPASVCASINQEVIHGIPSKRKLKSGDLLSLDMGVIYKGYFSDAAISLPIGKITKEADQLLKVTKECLYLGIEKATRGNRISDISKAIYNHAKKYNYGIVREFCGHALGFSLHEEPQIPNYLSRGPNPRLKKGMVLAIEPMINLGTDDIVILDDGWTVETKDQSLSAHFEHTIAVFDDKTEILTNWD
jgi:methionyl aminopeptidase